MPQFISLLCLASLELLLLALQGKSGLFPSTLCSSPASTLLTHSTPSKYHWPLLAFLSKEGRPQALKLRRVLTLPQGHTDLSESPGPATY